jgi:hypothetical protein
MRSSLLATSLFVLAASAALPATAQAPVTRPSIHDQIARIDRSVQSASAVVQAEVQKVPIATAVETQTIEAPAPAKTITVVTDAQKAALIQGIENFVADKKKQEQKFSVLTTTFIISAAVLALLASLASFMNLNRVAGVLGIVVIAAVGLPNVYPMAALADFYQNLTDQALALQTDCQFTIPFTKDVYDSSAAQLKALILFEANNRPKFGEGKVSTDDLTTQLQTLRTTAGQNP